MTHIFLMALGMLTLLVFVLVFMFVIALVFMFVIALVFMFVTALVFMIVTALVFMIMTAVAMRMSETAVSESVSAHHHSKTDSDANTDQAVCIHLCLLRLHLSDIFQSVGNRFRNDSRKGSTDHQTSTQSTDNRESCLSNA